MSTKLKLLYLGNQLSQHGFTPTSIETLGKKLEEDYHLVFASKQKSLIVRLLDMWSNVLFSRKLDFVLIDTYSTLAFHFAWTSAILCRLKGIPYIPILHGGDLPKRLQRSKRISSIFFNNAYQIVSPSKYLKSAVENVLPLEVKVIPNYIKLEEYPLHYKTIDHPKLLWVRSFHQIYNPSLAIKVLHQLRKKGLHASLCMIGPDKDGSMKVCKQLASELGVIESLEITGRLAKKEWIQKSQDFNIFVNTTNFDNTPVSVMEAMALGFPVITTNVGGIPFLFENHKEGIMVPPNDPAAMLNSILDLMDHPPKNANIQANARKKAESWDWKKVRLQWKSLLEGNE